MWVWLAYIMFVLLFDEIQTNWADFSAPMERVFPRICDNLLYSKTTVEFKYCATGR